MDIKLLTANRHIKVTMPLFHQKSQHRSLDYYACPAPPRPANLLHKCFMLGQMLSSLSKPTPLLPHHEEDDWRTSCSQYLRTAVKRAVMWPCHHRPHDHTLTPWTDSKGSLSPDWSLPSAEPYHSGDRKWCLGLRIVQSWRNSANTKGAVYLCLSIFHHFSTCGGENFSQMCWHLLKPNLLGKDRLFRNQSSQHLQNSVGLPHHFQTFNLFTLSWERHV